MVDAALDLYDLKHLEDLLNRKPEALKEKQSLLFARSQLPPAQPLGSIQGEKVSPHLSHPSRRLALGRVQDRAFGKATELQFRFAYHDLLDPEAGLPTTSEIQFFDFKLRHWDRRNLFRIETATVFGVTHLNPLREFLSEPSWKLKLLAKRFDDPRCENCTGLALEGGTGLSLEFAKSVLTYAMAETDLESASKFAGTKFQPRVGALLGSRVRFSPAVAAQIELKALRNFFSEEFTEASLLTRVRWVPLKARVGLELSGFWTSEREEALGSLYFYF